MTYPRPATGISRVASVAVAFLAPLGAAYSYASMYDRAKLEYGAWGARAFPLFVDLVVVVGYLYYISTCRRGRPQRGWKWLAHAGAASSIALNALAAGSLLAVPWHVYAPAVWAIIAELKGRELLGYHRAANAGLSPIPRRLWFTAPWPTFLDWLWMARANLADHGVARAARGRYIAAAEALRLTVPGWWGRPRQVRRLILQQVRRGTLTPADLISATGLSTVIAGTGPDAVLRAALLAALGASPSSAAAVPAIEVAGGATDATEGSSATEAAIPKGRAATDEEILADLTAWRLILDPKPGYRAVMDRYEIGDKRARRLNDLAAAGTGPRLSAVTGG